MNDFQFPLFARAVGRRQWRDALNNPLGWIPEDDDLQNGPHTDFADGIYIVTVNEATPDDWIHLARRASIVAEGEHPGPDFLPAYLYDSGIAVLAGRVVGGVLACRESPNFYRWNVCLKPDGTAYTTDEVQCADCDPNIHHPGRAIFDPTLRQRRYTPAIFTIWVHRSRRRQHIGSQLVRRIAEHFNLAVGDIGYRFALSREAVGMVSSLGLQETIGCF